MAERFSLSNKRHMNVFVGLLFAMGAMCPKCGTGTRYTSKRWARCKNEQCGERVARVSLSDIKVVKEPEGRDG